MPKDKVQKNCLKFLILPIVKKMVNFSKIFYINGAGASGWFPAVSDLHCWS